VRSFAHIALLHVAAPADGTSAGRELKTCLGIENHHVELRLAHEVVGGDAVLCVDVKSIWYFDEAIVSTVWTTDQGQRMLQDLWCRILVEQTS
jgi:hypothetical protein